MEMAAALFRVIDLVGVFINGIIGGTLARQKRFDVVGFGILAVISALGGGIVRDLMLMMGRPVALTDHYYLGAALTGAVLAWFFHFRGRFWRVAFPLLDGTALGVWAATGTVKALYGGLDWLPALLMGMVTAIGGGMIRDVMVGQVPTVLGDNKLYATPAMAAGLGVVFAHWAGLEWSWLMIIGTVLGMGLVTLGHFFDWRLPQHTDEPLQLTRPELLALLRRAERRGRRQGAAPAVASSEETEVVGPGDGGGA